MRSDPNALFGFWVEVKVGRDRLSPSQQEFIRREEECGGVVIVGTAGDLAKALEV
jgi:hypothetical protein